MNGLLRSKKWSSGRKPRGREEDWSDCAVAAQERKMNSKEQKKERKKYTRNIENKLQLDFSVPCPQLAQMRRHCHM